MAVSGQETPSRGGGRPEYKPTDEQRALVRKLRLQGASIAAIASELKLAPNTLRKHFVDDLAVDQAAPASGQLDLAGLHNAPDKATATASPAVGRPEFEPNYRQRDEVRLFKADNWSDDRIASYLGISRTTLSKHFGQELEFGVTQVRARVLRNLMRQSDDGSVSASDRILKLPGMFGPAERLPTPPAVEPELGKKEQAVRDAQTAHEGTSWDQVLMKH